MASNMLCRICCEVNNKTNAIDMIDIFDKRISNGPRLRLYILLATGVEIKQDDRVSKVVCEKCLKDTFTMFHFRTKAIKNDKMLKEKIGQPYLVPEIVYYDPDKPFEFNVEEKAVPSIVIDDENECMLDSSDTISACEENNDHEDEIPVILNEVDLNVNTEKDTSKEDRSSENRKNNSSIKVIKNQGVKTKTVNDISKNNRNKEVAKKIEDAITKSNTAKTPSTDKRSNSNKKVLLLGEETGKPENKLENNQKAPIFKTSESLNHPEINPHSSIKDLFSKYKGLELSGDVLLCNVKPDLILERCNTKKSLVLTLRRESDPTSKIVNVQTIEQSKDINTSSSTRKRIMDKKKQKHVLLFICSICNEVFTKRSILTIHSYLHHVCKHCSKKFKDAESLEMHTNNNCPQLHSMKDLKIKVKRCDEILGLRIKYKSAFDEYIEDTEDATIFNTSSDINIESDETFTNRNLDDEASSSKQIDVIEKNQSPNLVVNQQLAAFNNSKLRKMLQPNKETGKQLNRVHILENNIIFNSSEPLPKKVKLMTNDNMINDNKVTNKRPSHFVIVQTEIKKPRTYNCSSKIKDSLRERISNNFYNMTVKKSDKLAKRREEETKFLEDIMRAETSKSVCLSTQVETSDLLGSIPNIIQDINGVTLKNMNNEVNYHNIPIEWNVEPDRLVLSTKIDTSKVVNKISQQVDIRSMKAINIKPVGSSATKLPISKKIAFRKEDWTIIEIEDDSILNVPVGGQVNKTLQHGMHRTPVPTQINSNTVNSTNLNKTQKHNDVPITTVQHPHIVVQGTCIPTQRIYSSDLRTLLTNVSSSLPSIINQARNIPNTSTKQTTSTASSTSPIILNNMMQNQSSSNLQNFQINLLQVQQPETNARNKPQIRIKKPHEINKFN